MQRVAERQGEQVFYLSGDPLGSLSLVTDVSGDPVSQGRYGPFGEGRWGSGTSPTDFGYTGQRDDGTGLLDYHARFYDPVLGRFISPDSLIPDPGNPLDWDRYGYVRNDPINLTDPTGHRVDWGCLTEGCTSKHSDWVYHTVLVGSLPVIPPPTVRDETSSGNSSMEPEVNPSSNLARIQNEIDTVNTFGTIGLALSNSFGKKAIFVSMNYYEEPGGNLYTDSLQVDNRTTLSLGVTSVRFNVLCNGTCIGNGDSSYDAVPGLTIGSHQQTYGFPPIITPNGTTNISLVPSGNLTNPTNQIYPHQTVTATVQIGNVITGQYWTPLISRDLRRVLDKR